MSSRISKVFGGPAGNPQPGQPRRLRVVQEAYEDAQEKIAMFSNIIKDTLKDIAKLEKKGRQDSAEAQTQKNVLARFRKDLADCEANAASLEEELPVAAAQEKKITEAKRAADEKRAEKQAKAVQLQDASRSMAQVAPTANMKRTERKSDDATDAQLPVQTRVSQSLARATAAFKAKQLELKVARDEDKGTDRAINAARRSWAKLNKVARDPLEPPGVRNAAQADRDTKAMKTINEREAMKKGLPARLKLLKQELTKLENELEGARARVRRAMAAQANAGSKRKAVDQPSRQPPAQKTKTAATTSKSTKNSQPETLACAPLGTKRKAPAAGEDDLEDIRAPQRQKAEKTSRFALTPNKFSAEWQAASRRGAGDGISTKPAASSRSIVEAAASTFVKRYSGLSKTTPGSRSAGNTAAPVKARPGRGNDTDHTSEALATKGKKRSSPNDGDEISNISPKKRSAPVNGGEVSNGGSKKRTKLIGSKDAGDSKWEEPTGTLNGAANGKELASSKKTLASTEKNAISSSTATPDSSNTKDTATLTDDEKQSDSSKSTPSSGPADHAAASPDAPSAQQHTGSRDDKDLSQTAKGTAAPDSKNQSARVDVDGTKDTGKRASLKGLINHGNACFSNADIHFIDAAVEGHDINALFGDLDEVESFGLTADVIKKFDRTNSNTRSGKKIAEHQATLRAAIKAAAKAGEVDKISIVKHFRQLLEDMHVEDQGVSAKVASPYLFQSVVAFGAASDADRAEGNISGRQRMSGDTQEDAFECYQLMYNDFVDDATAGDGNALKAIFEVETETQDVCDRGCGYKSDVRKATSSYHGVDVPRNEDGESESLNDILNVSMTSAKDGNCPQCKKGTLTAKTQITSFPDALVLTINRTAYGKRASKVNTIVELDKSINVQGSSYDLAAVVMHRGNMKGGHYTIFRKFQGQWYRIDDKECYPETRVEENLRGDGPGSAVMALLKKASA